MRKYKNGVIFMSNSKGCCFGGLCEYQGTYGGCSFSGYCKFQF